MKHKLMATEYLHNTGTVSQDVTDGPNKFAAQMCTARYLVKLNKSDITYLKMSWPLMF